MDIKLLLLLLLISCSHSPRVLQHQSHPTEDTDFIPDMDTKMTKKRPFKVTWLGFGGIHIETKEGKVLLIDPWTKGSPIQTHNFDKLKKPDLILITHAHRDHIGDSVSIAKESGAKIMAIYELVFYLEQMGVKNFVRINKGGTYNFYGIEISMVTAVHSNNLYRDNQLYYAGDAAGYVIRLKDGATLYHAGDTDVFGDMKIISDLYKPDYAFLPIGGTFTMGPRGAAYAARLLNVKNIVPLHHGGLPTLKGKPVELKSLLPENVTLQEMEIGKTYQWK